MKPRELIGSGDKIIPFAIPFILIGLYVNKVNPTFFRITPISSTAQTIFTIILLIGLVLWLWSVYLIVTKARRGKLIENGPFRLVLHPIYLSVSLLVIPFWGLIYNSWLGIFVGAVFYIGRTFFVGDEEKKLAKMFGDKWKKYKAKVLFPWL